jgi:type I restriction enzyme S subunit
MTSERRASDPESQVFRQAADLISKPVPKVFSELIDQGVLEIGDGYRAKNNELGGNGLIFLRAGHVKDTHIDFDGVDHFKVIDKSRFKGKMSHLGDVVVTTKGNSTGRIAFVTSGMPEFVYSPHLSFWRSRDESVLCQGFLRAWSRGVEFNLQLQSMSRSTDMAPYLSLTDQKRLKITLPAIEQQRSVSELLDALEDRITLLRETNTTLEAIAQALFKSWFVDFDPVRANAEGIVPEGMAAGTAALFPDNFEESELGLVPRGWEVVSVADVAEVVKGKSYSSKDLVGTHHTALVTLKSFARGGGFRLDGFKPYVGNYKSSQVVMSGDLIVAYTDVTQAAELIGKPAIVVGVEDYQTLVASLDVGVIRPDTAKVSRQYLYGLFRTESFQNHTFAHTSGTTVLHLAKDGVGTYQFVCPPHALVHEFSSIAEALAERGQNNMDQMRAITQLRDTLLPRLISGQPHLPETEASIKNMLSEAI